MNQMDIIHGPCLHGTGLVMIRGEIRLSFIKISGSFHWSSLSRPICVI